MLPFFIIFQTLGEIFSKSLRKSLHELCACSDSTFKEKVVDFVILSRWFFYSQIWVFFIKHLSFFFSFFLPRKPTRSLTPIFSCWSNSIDSKIDQLSRLEYLHHTFYFFKYLIKNCTFIKILASLVLVCYSHVNYVIHIEIKVINARNFIGSRLWVSVI